MHLQTFMAAVALVVAGITGQPTHAATKMGEPVSSTQSETVLPTDAAVANMPEAVLKASYLACKNASQSPSDAETMAKCSMVERELVRKVFRGNVGAFETWSRTAAPDTERSKEDPRAPLLAPEPVGE